MTVGVRSNRLARESSPYLLQHAYNPVDWYPWGDEAFEAAARLDRPIFLSIGYSSCHWCHVMEGECFEDDEVASLMNSTFVNIKVDREERPDIDAVYMKACQLMTGGGGWPLSIVMTPDKRPFYAATYIPKISRHGVPGMVDIVPMIRSTWNERRGDIDQVADRVLDALAKVPTISDGQLGPSINGAYDGLTDSYEDKYGGFEVAPKFPTPHRLMFLMRYWRKNGEEKARKMAEWTLRCMMLGGIHDHVGGGFHRYSTDRRWFLPHFEKMLYDQALLSMAFVDGHMVTGEISFKEAAIGTMEYVIRDLSHPDGGFYSSEDADSREGEGAFYTWTRDDIERLVRKDDLPVIIELFNIRAEGNYRQEGGGRYDGRNVLHMEEDVETYAKRKGLRKETVEVAVSDALKALYKARARRERPRLDDKVLLDWNGLMIAALAKAGRALRQPRFIERAERASAFIESRMMSEDGRLLHRFRDGKAGIDGFLTDHAFYAWGLIELYQATLDPRYLKMANRCAGMMVERFGEPNGGFVTSRSEDLIAREMEIYDGAIPSGNSVALLVCTLLAELGFDEPFRRMAEMTGRRFAAEVSSSPEAHCFFIIGAMVLQDGASVVKVRRDTRGHADEDVRTLIDRTYAPEVIMTVGEGTVWKDDRSIAQVCKGSTCLPPVTDAGALRRQLEI